MKSPRGTPLLIGLLIGAPAGLVLGALLLGLGVVIGQAQNLGWGLPLGTSLAFAVACLSLGVAVYQAHATRRHNRLLVQPHLIFESQFNSTTEVGHFTYRLGIKNVGLGPAIFGRYSIALEDSSDLDAHSVFEEWVKLVNKSTRAKGLAICKAGFLYQGQALDKGSDVVLLEASFPIQDLSFMKGREIAKGLVKQINATLDYQCHYGRSFRVAKKLHGETKDAVTVATHWRHSSTPDDGRSVQV